jgi:hypothetical protein
LADDVSGFGLGSTDSPSEINTDWRFQGVDLREIEEGIAALLLEHFAMGNIQKVPSHSEKRTYNGLSRSGAVSRDRNRFSLEGGWII